MRRISSRGLVTLVVLSFFIFGCVNAFYRILLSRLEKHITENPVRLDFKGFKGMKGSLFSGLSVSFDTKGSSDSTIPFVASPKGTTLTKDADSALSKLSLLGTVSGDPESSFAVIEDKELRKQRILRIGDTIEGGVITRILKDRVIIRFGEMDEILAIDARGYASAAGKVGQNPTSEFSYQDIFGGTQSTEPQADIVPTTLDDGTGGLQILDIKPGSAYEKLGIKNGDIIQEIDGKAIKDPQEIASLCEKLRSIPPNEVFGKSGIDVGQVMRLLDQYSIRVPPEYLPLIQKLASGQNISLVLSRMGERKNFTYRFR